MDDTHYCHILELFQYLPRFDDQVLHQLWAEKRLRFDDTEGKADSIDLCCAQLVCATLTLGKPLLIVLPDHAPRRLPLIFATGLIMHAMDFFGRAKNHHIVYFGTSATIKDYLSQTSIGREKLSDIFSQTNSGRASKAQSGISGNLPCVVFSYAPANAEAVLETYNPQWVFLDCGDGDNSDWIHPLLERLDEKKITGIACIQNPLSNVLSKFQEYAWNIFSWDTTPDFSIEQTEITPFVIKSELAMTHAGIFQAVSRTLSGCAKQINGRLQGDAWRSVGRYVRGLENLPVPIPFFGGLDIT